MKNSNFGKITMGFDQYSDPDLSLKGTTIDSSMTDNGNFPNNPYTQEVSDRVLDYNVALTDAQSRNRSAVATKDIARAALITVLIAQGLWVIATAQGDKAKLASSGYDPAKGYTPPGPVTRPENLVVNSMSIGELEFSVDYVANAKSYLFQCRNAANTNDKAWITEGSTSRKYTMTNLDSGINYACRVGAVGSKGQIVYSNIIYWTAQ